ncbi:MAG: mechanosensitive ion channel [Candidatus Rifleibacteriota bacterium]
MIAQVLSSLKARFDPEFIAKWVVSVSPGIISAILTFVIFWLIYHILSRSLSFMLSKASLDRTLCAFFKDLLKYVVVGAGILSALNELGLNTSSIIASLGVAGLTIGFAAKDTLSNLMSGLFIFWDRPFRVGDLVIIAGQYGKVSEITLRSTRIVTPDGKMVSFPNSKVIDSPLTSYTNFPNLRISHVQSFPASADIDVIRKDYNKLFVDDDRFIKEPKPEVNIVDFSATAMKIEFSVWIKDETKHLALENTLREKIYKHYKSFL